MRVFVTGASGYIGNAVAKAFREKGHTVYGLVRSKENAIDLSKEEICPIIGSLEKPDTYSKILDEVEVVTHCAFDSSNKGAEQDGQAIDNILNKFSKSPLSHALIYTSGVWVYGSTEYKMVDESHLTHPINLIKWRPQHEQKVLKATAPNLRTVVIRPGCVYGGIKGLTTLLFNSIQEGSVVIPGEGKNRWAMVHIQDLAHAYVSAAEKELTHTILNVTDDSSSTLREIAEAIARSAGIPDKVRSLSTEEANKKFGSITEGLMLDQKINNTKIKRLLHWQIHHAAFVDEIDTYYQAWKATQ